MPFELEFEDTFDGERSTAERWLPWYLPHWSNRARSTARYSPRRRVPAPGDHGRPAAVVHRARRRHEGVVAADGPVRRPRRQHRRPASLRREGDRHRGPGQRAPLHAAVRPRRGAREGDRRPARHGRALDDRLRRRARALGRDLRLRDLRPRRTRTTGPRWAWASIPSATRRSSTTSRQVHVPIDAREFHVYAAEWPTGTGRLLRRRRAREDGRAGAGLSAAAHAGHLRVPPTGRARAASYPKEFVVDYVRGYRLT